MPFSCGSKQGRYLSDKISDALVDLNEFIQTCAAIQGPIDSRSPMGIFPHANMAVNRCCWLAALMLLLNLPDEIQISLVRNVEKQFKLLLDSTPETLNVKQLEQLIKEVQMIASTVTLGKDDALRAWKATHDSFRVNPC